VDPAAAHGVGDAEEIERLSENTSRGVELLRTAGRA
jgi:hypothetical protein